MECLPADAAAQIEHRWRGRQIATEGKCPRGAIAVPRPLPGERLIKLEEDRPEVRWGFAHVMPFRRLQVAARGTLRVRCRCTNCARREPREASRGQAPILGTLGNAGSLLAAFGRAATAVNRGLQPKSPGRLFDPRSVAVGPPATNAPANCRQLRFRLRQVDMLDPLGRLRQRPSAARHGRDRRRTAARAQNASDSPAGSRRKSTWGRLERPAFAPRRD